MTMGPHDLLIGWKAISRHMQKSPRQLQTWAKYDGLPVVKYGRGRNVVITPHLIELWLMERGKRRRDGNS
jgi:hypothetical protein